MVPTIEFGPILFKALTMDVILIYLQEEADRLMCIEKLHAALVDGGLRIPVQEIYGLDQVANVHEAVEAGGRAGAVLVKL